MSKVLAYYHIVFCTKERRMTLPLDQCEHLYRFLWKMLDERNCRLLRIGGVQNHVHMLINLHPSIALSALMKDLKGHSAGWLNRDSRFPDFNGWAREYYASTISENLKDTVINYIKTQKEHHLLTAFDDELEALCRDSGLVYDDRDMR